jgi:hypothetical protein
VGPRRTIADEVGGYPLVCFERGVKADRQSRTSKLSCVVKMNWMIVSACHAGSLGDNRTPVGSGRFRDQTRDCFCIPGLFLALLIQDLPTYVSLLS